MESFVVIAAIIFGIIGILGSIIPGIPGPPMSWIGLMILYFWGSGANSAGEPMGMGLVIAWLAITIIVTVVDYIVPAFFTKVTGGTKYGGWGAIIGLFVGLVWPPVGMIAGSLLGAFLAELIFAEKDLKTSLKSSIGAFLGFIFGTGAKLICSGIMMYYIIVYAF